MRRVGLLLSFGIASLVASCGEPRTPSRVMILGLDGVDPDVAKAALDLARYKLGFPTRIVARRKM